MQILTGPGISKVNKLKKPGIKGKKMDQKQNSQKQNKPVKKERACPFDKTLKCKNCRLFIEIPGYPDIHRCALIQAAIK